MEVMSFGGDDMAKGNTNSSKIMMRGDDSLCEWIVAPVAFVVEWIRKTQAAERGDNLWSAVDAKLG